jgi:hypothetical protein
LFHIKDLAQLVQIEVKVTNEQRSATLTDFFRQAIDLIQAFIHDKQLIDHDRSVRLAKILEHMKFICVDSMELLVNYDNIIWLSLTTSTTKETYIDENTSRFYILKVFEGSEMRYIDAMVSFLVNDESARMELSKYMKRLVLMHQSKQVNALEEERAKITRNYEPTWTISLDTVNDMPEKDKQSEEITEDDTSSDLEDDVNAVLAEPSKRVQKPDENKDKSTDILAFPSSSRSTELNTSSTVASIGYQQRTNTNQSSSHTADDNVRHLSNTDKSQTNGSISKLCQMCLSKAQPMIFVLIRFT